MRRSLSALAVLGLVVAALPETVLHSARAQVPTTLDDFFMPGSQPGDSGNLEHPEKCDNCHGGYDAAVEPAFNWRGSMMAQAARDPLFYATMAIANQDAPDSGDLCLRCHTPAGWLEGRSVPTDGSALNNNDLEGVQCDFCHKLIAPAQLGTNPYPGDDHYIAETLVDDQDYLSTLDAIPPTSANGMYIADSVNAKRGPFVDAQARHQMLYSPFHSESAICGTCHDVSNPAFSRQGDGSYFPNELGQPAPDAHPRALFPVERTYSEWLVSDFGPGGIAPASCQDCHMRNVTGYGCNKKGTPLRHDLPLHDMTGGNTIMPALVAELFPDAVDPAALVAGMGRAAATLREAATMALSVEAGQDDGFVAKVTVTNNTGHKLPSGYPEGRRIWINLKAYGSDGTIVYESGAYNFETGDLTEDADAKIYEIKPGISEDLSIALGLPAGPSFHFVLNHKVFKDNRIPPRGASMAALESIQSPSVDYYKDQDDKYVVVPYLHNSEGWEETAYTLPAETVRVTATLYYQTTSKEYVEFLRDNNDTDDWGNVMYDLWLAYDKFPPVVMAEATWGDAPPDDEPPAAPTGLSATARSDSRIDLSWTASTDNVGVAGYDIYRGGQLVAENVVDVAYRDDGLQASTTYTYYVIAYDAAGNVSTPSNDASATTKRQKGGGKSQ